MTTAQEKAPAPRPRWAEESLFGRVVAYLIRAGWTEIERWEESDESGDLPSDIVLTLERSGFYLSAAWEPSSRQLLLSDGSEEWEWAGDLPALSPLPDPVVIELPVDAPDARNLELARRTLVTHGLLDATRVIVPEEAPFHFIQLTQLLFLWYVHGAAERHRGTDAEDVQKAFAAEGEEVSYRLAAGMHHYPIIVPDPVPRIAGLGIAEWCWRRESDVERWHQKVDDLTMARANIAATRAVWPHVHPEGVDWAGVRLALAARHRRLADGRLLAELFEEGWEPIMASIHREIDLWERLEDQLGSEAVLRLLTLHGSRTESLGNWWGSGSYESIARAALAKALEAGRAPAEVTALGAGRLDDLADQILYAPDLLDDDALGWLIDIIFDEESLRRRENQQPGAGVVLQDWEIDALAEILGPDEDPEHP